MITALGGSWPWWGGREAQWGKAHLVGDKPEGAGNDLARTARGAHVSGVRAENNHPPQILRNHFLWISKQLRLFGVKSEPRGNQIAGKEGNWVGERDGESLQKCPGATTFQKETWG